MKKIIIVALLFCLPIIAQTKLFHLDLTDTTNFTFGGTDADGRKTVYEIRGSGTYNPIFRQTDTTKQPIWRIEEGLYFQNNHYMTLFSGNKIIPTTSTIFIVARHLGRTPSTYPAYIIGDTSSLIGYDDITKGLRVVSSTGGYLQRRIDEYGGMKSVLTFRIRANTIDTLLIQGTDEISTITLGGNLKFGILGAYHTGSAFSRFWSGYIYEIIVYEGNLSNAQIDSVHNVLSKKHKTPIKPLLIPTVPYSTQPTTGTGTSSDPFLIYSVWGLDSLRYIYPKNQVYYVKIMNDIDFSNHPNFFIDSLIINLDGNHKTFRNWYHKNSLTNESHCLFSSYLNTTVYLKNLTFENFLNIAPAGLYSNSTASFYYKYNSGFILRVDSVLVKRSLIRAETRATISNTVYIYPFSFYLDYVNKVGFIETEIILSSKSASSEIFRVNFGNTISQIFTDKNTVLGKYFTNGGSPTSIFTEQTNTILNSYFRHKIFYVEYSQAENMFSGGTFGVGISQDCCYPIRQTRFIDKSYFSGSIIYTIFGKNYQNLSLDYMPDNGHNLDSVFIDTTNNRGFNYYPTNFYTGAKPQPKSRVEMQNQSLYLNWDFENTWKIEASKNDGLPYLNFYIPESQAIKVLYPNSTITKYGGDTLIITFQSLYDTNKIYFINNTDTTLIQTTTLTNYTYTLPYGINSNLCKIKVANSLNTDYDVSDTSFILLRDTSVIINKPLSNEMYDQNDTLRVEFIADFDTAKIYFRLTENDAWEYKGKTAVVNRNGIFSFILNYNITLTARVMITNQDSSIIAISGMFYILPRGYIQILSPTETDQRHYSNGLFLEVISAGINDFELYYDIGDGYKYETTISVSVGDGQEPDTTTYIFDYKKYLISGMLKIMVRKGNVGEIRGSIDTAYYQQSMLSFAGLRSPYQQYQSMQQFSKIFQQGDSIYTVSYYAYAYGWYDYYDRIEVYKFNPQTNFFIKILSKGYPSSAPYPNFNFYRSTNSLAVLVKPNVYYRTVSFDIDNYALSEMSGLIYKSNTNPIPPNLDEVPTTTVVANFWQYKLENNKIFAYDLINNGNNILLIDLSQSTAYSTGLKQNFMELFVFNNKLFVTNHSYSGYNLSSHTYTLPLLPQNTTLLQDDITINLIGVQRNNFRGIYPKAIIRVVPKL